MSRPHRIAVTGWLRIAFRLAALVALFLACLAGHGLWALARRRHRPWPRRFLAGVTRIVGVGLIVAGERAPDRVLILANHVSWIDIPAIAAASGTAFVGHDGLTMVPLLHWLCRLNNTVFVARHDRRSVAAQVASVREALATAGALTVFPEGTTSDGTGLLAFKSSLLGALDPLPGGLAVQPVALDYGAEAAQIAWIGTEHGLDNFLRILARRRPLHLRLQFLPVLPGEALASRKTIAAAAREAILSALGAPR